MTDLTEVLGSQPEQGRAVELRVAADVIVLLGRELVVVLVEPLLGGRVLGAREHRNGVPVVALTRQVVTPLEEQDPFARRRELPRERAATGSAPDDHDVV